jgi:hypothetical protein
MVLPVLKGLLFALSGERVGRLGGHKIITLADLAREYREGSGDCGICFEYAVHDAIRKRDPRVYNLVSEVIEEACGISGGAESILFGAEKTGAVSLIETPDTMITSDARILAGKVGQPAKLRKNWDKIRKALRDQEAREALPESIKGLWKADLFVGNVNQERWVGTTLKINPRQFEGAPGLRIGIYPEQKKGEMPSIDPDKNLALCPLPYNASFMELFYSSFFIVKTFCASDARVPKPVALPNSSDRYVASLLEQRRGFSILDVVEAMGPLAQPQLLKTSYAGEQLEFAPIIAVAPVAQLTR